MNDEHHRVTVQVDREYSSTLLVSLSESKPTFGLGHGFVLHSKLKVEPFIIVSNKGTSFLSSQICSRSQPRFSCRCTAARIRKPTANTNTKTHLLLTARQHTRPPTPCVVRPASPHARASTCEAADRVSSVCPLVCSVAALYRTTLKVLLREGGLRPTAALVGPLYRLQIVLLFPPLLATMVAPAYTPLAQGHARAPGARRSVQPAARPRCGARGAGRPLLLAAAAAVAAAACCATAAGCRTVTNEACVFPCAYNTSAGEQVSLSKCTSLDEDEMWCCT